MQTNFGGAQLRDQNFLAENGQKVDKFEPISLITDTDEKWFVVFEHTIKHFSFDYIRLPQIENYFSCFPYFFLLFFSCFFFFCRYLRLNH